uniref:Troponin n=1 Tax=Onchocerca volvulus TaxID=6282 RepID=A0A8R1Y0J9_ONCVO
MDENKSYEVPECEDRPRYGGPLGEDDDSFISFICDSLPQEAKRKAEEREMKKAEVRKRLEEAGKKKAKKGFLTPERKKKLRKLLMMKAAEDLKQQQLLKEQERQKVLSQRTIPLPDVDTIDDHGKLEAIYNQLFQHMLKLEEEKYDINQAVMAKDAEINELTIAVNDLRGKFVKPTLKKVSKYDNKFKKMAGQKEDKQDFRANLKVVKKENVIDDIVNKQLAKKTDKPEWSKKGAEKAEAEEKKQEAPVEESAPPEEVAEDEAAEEGDEGDEEAEEEEEEEEE